MKSLAFLLLFMVASTDLAQPSPSTQTTKQGRGPVKTIKIGKASFHYYQKPEVVVATTSFYVSGSETKAVLFDFVALTVIFHNPGQHLATPSFVRFNLSAATYRDGCKYRDRYADKTTNQLHLNVLADEKSVFVTDLDLGQVGEVQTRHGKVCTEVYMFEMPYPQFLTLIAARKAGVKLGTREFRLKGDQLQAMRTMRDGIGQY